MDIEKRIYILIENDLQRLEDKKSELSKIIKANQRGLYIETLCNSILNRKTYSYKNLLILTSTLIKKIGLPNNSISYSQVIENLIFNGYFSYGELIPYQRKDNINPLDLSGFRGIDVIRKEGVCRHFSSLHHDLFNKLGLFDNLYYCFEVSQSDTYCPPIDDKYDFLKGDHVANVLEYNGQYYIHCTYNKRYYYFIDSFCAEQYGGKVDKLFLFYTPILNQIFSTKDYQQVLKQIRVFDESSQKPHITIQELNDIINQTNERFYNSSKLLSDFREEALPYMKKIVSPGIKH